MGMDLNKILHTWEIRIFDLLKLQLGLVKTKKINQILITECGNPFHKIIATAEKQKE